VGQDSKQLISVALRQASTLNPISRCVRLSRCLSFVALATVASGLTGCSAIGGDVVVEPQRLSVQTLLSFQAPLLESSGLALHDNWIWSMNDSAGASRLYGFDLSRLGQPNPLERQVDLDGAVNFDWEALATNERDLYVVDCGNNRGDRIWLQLYQIPLKSLSQERAVVRRSDFRWGDVQYAVARRDHNNDCEAATWIGDKLWLFTKNWQDLHSRVYKLNPTQSQQSLYTEQRLAVGGLITGADYSAYHQTLALLGYGSGIGMLQPFIWLVPLSPSAQQIEWNQAKRYDLAQPGQWEAIHWYGEQLLITREKSILGPAEVARVTPPNSALSNR